MTKNIKKNQGAHSPGARVLSMGVYPIQAIKSQILDQSDVSCGYVLKKKTFLDSCNFILYINSFSM